MWTTENRGRDDRDRPAMTPCEVADSVLEPGHNLIGDASPGLRIVRDCEAKERSLPRPGDGTLLRVDLELETSLDEAGQACHDPLAGLFAADIDVAVIRIAHEAVARRASSQSSSSSTRFRDPRCHSCHEFA